jgi:chromosome segregation protein
MYLKTLRMRGFKSFAQSVELRFEHGIAVVVGPNGSGKSNIADALQWAMAVQSPAQLRAPSGQDVLFGGTDSRPPSGVCEVELVLDNECETLPIEFGEVSVMRRLHRDGESEYFINRARVRRLDVLELLSDTGLGREMHSVIGQGKVEEILLAKPHERRRFVEEAAGLGKYQRRRTRSEQKLARVATELERARDLEREVRARLRPLAMQATAADRAAKLGQEIAQGRISLLSSELLVESRRTAELRGRLEGVTSARSGIDAELVAIASRRSAAETELAGLAAAQERATRAFYAFETGRERVEAERSRLARARAALDRSEAWRREDAARRQADAARLRLEAEAAEAAAAEHVAEAAALEAQHGGGLDEAAAAAEAALAAALDARRAHAEAEGQAANVRREHEAAVARVAELGERLEALGSASEDESARLDAAQAAVSALTARQAEAATGVAAAEAAAAAAEADFARAGEAAREARLRAEGLAEDASRDRARLESLELALRRGDGLSPAAQALRDSGARLVLAGIEAEPGYERAVAAALGWRAGAVVAERLDQALDLLEQGDGELNVVTAGGDGRAAGEMPAGARPLAEVVRIIDRSLAPLVAGIWLVDDVRGVQSGVAVTAEGVGLDADRGEAWRIADVGEASWLRARGERDSLAAGLAEREQAAEQAHAEAETAGTDAATAATADAAARDRLRDARRDEQEAADELRRASGARDALADELARRDAGRDLAARDLESESARLTELHALLAGYEGSLAERRSAALAADERHAALEMTRRRLADEAARQAARRAALDERIERFRGEGGRALEAAERAEAAAQRSLHASVQAAEAAPAVDRLVAELDAALAAASGLAEPARAGIDTIERRAGELAAELQACAMAEAEAQGRAREIQAAATEVEVSLARSSERIDDVGRRRAELAAEHSLDVSEPEEPLAADDAAAAAARLERLERRRESLGAVNPLAQEEYEQEKVRADDLSTQCEDLETSLAELRALIKDLTITIDQRFAATFDSVARNFEEVIGTLFPGGRGRLRLTEEVVPDEPFDGQPDDGSVVDAAGPRPPVERGIDLEVKPAGKRIESLSLLSGGEKSLTAIAFLFALMLTKPSPFYLLDEVEAALDDANIDRFLDLLRAYQDRAQFLVVTHQRRTMEVADVLYGVTMAGDGVSTVLSRRMPSDPELHEAALESA